ncbi:MAG TPA: class B sortase [Candidatus Fournierella merdavium]|nr:class B sortase [Candidatus Fournierella merdavium]
MKQVVTLLLAAATLLVGCAGTASRPASAVSTVSNEEQQEQAPADPRLAEAQATNPDTVAWLTVPGTNIDGPVQQAEDNEYYLRRDERGEPSHDGCYFSDYECDFSGDTLSTNTIIYGHTFTAPGQDPNIGFGQLNAFLDAEFSTEHTQIFLSVASRQFTFEIKSVGIASAEQDGVCILASPGWAQQQELVRLANERNVIEGRELEAVGGQKLLTLATCTDDASERLVIVAELVLPQQR